MKRFGSDKLMARHSFRRATLCAAPVLIAALGGCASGPSAQPGLAVSEPPPAAGQIDPVFIPGANYILRPADVIRVTVFREDALSLESVTLSGAGTISVPLAGQVKAAGLTPAQLESELERVLSARYLRHPDVAVNVVEYASHQVIVEGAVKTPGVYKFMPGMRLSAGISLAEGPAREAKLGNIAVFRQTAEGMEIAKFDYGAVRAGTMEDPVLKPGDRVVVGTDGLAVFWQDLLKALPAFALFTRF